MKNILLLAFLSTILAVSLLAADQTEQENTRLQASADVIKEVMNTPDKGIPTDLFAKAYCVVVIPGMKKAGFIFSAKYGRGYASCREGGQWSAPAAMRVEGGGVGFQIGASDTDVVMLVMSRKGMNGILSSKFTLGAGASVAAGPVGRDAAAQTDASMHADILSWSRSRGLFAGISLDGATLRQDEEADRALYGHDVNSKDALMGTMKDTLTNDTFTQTLTQYGGEHRMP
jgi:lipid-binding SYLF domain-containing protein